MTDNLSNQRERFYLLDISRAVAATCVVLQHYQHFYFLPGKTLPLDFVRNQQPFYEIIKPFYLFGTVAVQFFFVLSGFIFFYMYNKKIYEKKINLRNFFILRVSRLYPLHLLTLLFVMILQICYFNLNGEYFVNSINDFKHFVYHFFLIQQWGLAETDAFNAPSWSISVEILLYVGFFLLATFGIKNLTSALSVLILSVLILVINNSIAYELSLGTVFLGFVCFYIGGVTYFIFQNIKDLILKKKTKIILFFLILLLNVIVFAGFLNEPFLILQKNYNYLFGNNFFILLFFVKFPLIILNLTLIQIYFKNMGRSFQIIGDISYTIYLLHFLIQIIFSIVDKSFLKINFDSNYVFLLFFSILFFSSFLIYKYFEIKAKIILRKKFIEL